MEGVKLQPCKIIKIRFFILFLSLSFVSVQLIGFRGVIKLKEGVEYRDVETVESSKAVANFAKSYQPSDDKASEKRS